MTRASWHRYGTDKQLPYLRSTQQNSATHTSCDRETSYLEWAEILDRMLPMRGSIVAHPAIIQLGQSPTPRRIVDCLKDAPVKAKPCLNTCGSNACLDTCNGMAISWFEGYHHSLNDVCVCKHSFVQTEQSETARQRKRQRERKREREGKGEEERE